MTDSPVQSKISNPPLSPELSVNRSFRQKLKRRTRTPNELQKKDGYTKSEHNFQKQQSPVKIDKIEKEDTFTTLTNNPLENELDLLFKLEEERKSITDQISFSKKVSGMKDHFSVPNTIPNFTKESNSLDNKAIVFNKKSADQIEFLEKNEGTSTNILKNENIYDLGFDDDLSCFQKASTSGSSNICHKNQEVVKLIPKTSILDIFEIENLMQIAEQSGFTKHKIIPNKLKKDEFSEKASEGNCLRSNVCDKENFGDLNQFDVEFQKDSIAIQKYNESIQSKGGPLNKDLKNIFNDEDFSDLKLSDNQYCGFEKASYSLHSPKTMKIKPRTTIKDKDLKQLQSEPGSLKEELNNIFKDENFCDLKIQDEYCGFQKVSNTIKNIKSTSLKVEDSVIPSTSKNSNNQLIINKNIADVFKDFDLSDVIPSKGNVNDFAKPFVSSKLILKKNPSEIFNDFDLSDLPGPSKAKDFNTHAEKKKTPAEIFKDFDLSDVTSLPGHSNYKTFHQNAVNKPSIFSTSNENPKKKNPVDIFKDFDLSDVKSVPGSSHVNIPNKNAIGNPVVFSSSNKNITKKNPADIFKDFDLSDVMPLPGPSNVNVLNKNAVINSVFRSESTKNVQKKNPVHIFKDFDLSDVMPLPGPSNVKTLNTNTIGKSVVSSKSKNPVDIFEDFDLSDVMPLGEMATKPIPGFLKIGPSGNNLDNREAVLKSNDFSTKKNEIDLIENEANSPENAIWITNFENVDDFRGFSNSDQLLSLKLGMRFCQQTGLSDEFLATKYEELIEIKSNKRKLLNKDRDNELPASKKFRRDSNENKTPDFTKFKNHSGENQSFLRKPAKKRLGAHFTPSVTMSSTNLEKAQSFFRDDLSVRPFETSTPVFSKFGNTITPMKFHPNLTPIRENDNTSLVNGTNVSTRLFFENETRNLSLPDRTVVPKSFSLNKPTEGDVHTWLDNLEVERKLVEQRLRVICEKQSVLEIQQRIVFDRRLVRGQPGTLYNSKSQHNRVSLKSIGLPGATDNLNVGQNFLNMINPQNAVLVHFGIDQGQAYVRTTDGAELIPNSKGRIGVSEIEHGFSVMPNVDHKLVPEGWVKNHYRWIIWKLASYERMYPERFKGLFSLENVIQQLKYRYDREIDKVERSALKKIFEKDDCPEKRLVLCVSNIKKVDKDYELELTDNWYPIRTIIDRPLSKQIARGKLKIGTKIMICGAEMLNNNDGCTPLEASNNICLKISYNSTRRVRWWAKLGYQADPTSFRIPLSSVDIEGGRIGCIKFYVARVYPIKYLEKIQDNNVWRNYKAEEKKAQQWETEQCSRLEKLANQLNEKIEETQDSPAFFENVATVEDPEILHKILKESKDPERVNEMLTSSQRTSLLAYQVSKSSKKQSRIINEIQKKAGHIEKRNVTPLLRIRVLDVGDETNEKNDHNFYVWNPQEYHLTALKEGEVMSAYNVACSTNWGLSANKNTKIKEEPKLDLENFQKFRRKLTRIDSISGNDKSFPFREFDTVGIVIKVDHSYSQELWLSSISQRLLFIRIYESPQNVLLLEGLKEGDVIIASNILFKEVKEDGEYVAATADYYSCISKYSKYSLLQEEATCVSQQLENSDISSFIQSAQQKINKIGKKSLVQSGLPVEKSWYHDDGMDCSQMTTTDMALLECISKLES